MYKYGEIQFCSSFLFQWSSTHLFAILVKIIEYFYKDTGLDFHSCQWHLETLILWKTVSPQKLPLGTEFYREGEKLFSDIPTEFQLT